MKKILSITTFICFVLFSCNTTKKTTFTEPTSLEGNWELNYISEHGDLYLNKKPSLNFNAANNSVSGNSSCNNFNGAYTINGSTIKFSETMAMTRMICNDGQSEAIFISTLNKINHWSVSEENKTLNLMMDNKVMMKFTKK